MTVMNLLQQLLVFYLPVGVLALAIAGAGGWLLVPLFKRRGLKDDNPHGWLRHQPIIGLLTLGGLLLPITGWPFLPSAFVLALLLLPAVFVMAFRYLDIQDDSHLDVRLDRQAFLHNGWYDTAIILIVYLFGGLLIVLLSPEIQTLLYPATGDILLALPVGIIAGLMLGLAFYQLRNRFMTILEKRRKAKTFNRYYDGLMTTGQNFIESILTQFHGTALTGVLLILAAVIPFTTITPRLALAVFAVPLMSSAMLAGLLVEKPLPNEPGFWSHLRKGFANTAQMAVGYLIGTALLAPLDFIHAWILAEPGQVMEALGTHLELTFVALVISLALGLVGGVLSSRIDSLRTILTNLGNVGRTIPSLAVLALALPIFGVGFTPSLVALIFIGTLPILINTTVGIMEVSAQIKEAAVGMGFNDRQVLFQVELPIALPVIMAGIRTSAVLVVASATLAGFIGGGGLGSLIIRGDGSGRADILFTGAVLATILAIFLENLFAWLEALLTPRGLRN